MKPIFLIGYMGSGKSTLGHAVSGLTRIPFIDLDDYIEQHEGLTVKEIFARDGEAGFRRLEREALLEIADRGDVIIACGGGTPCFHGNMELMNSRGTTVWLEAPVTVLHRRLIEGGDTRPLIAGKSPDELLRFIIKALDCRRQHYSRASARFDSSRLETEEEIAETSARFITQFIDHND